MGIICTCQFCEQARLALTKIYDHQTATIGRGELPLCFGSTKKQFAAYVSIAIRCDDRDIFDHLGIDSSGWSGRFAQKELELHRGEGRLRPAVSMVFFSGLPLVEIYQASQA